jgi:hypothetical protein
MDTDALNSIVNSDLLETRQRVMAGLQQSPDEAAKVVGLEQASGIPSQVIQGDTEGFERNYRFAMADKLVMGNPELREYVRSHPMAAAVSNDDWGNLDSLSDRLKKLRQASDASSDPFQMAANALTRGMSGAATGATEPLTEPVPQYTTGDIAKQFPALGPQGGMLGPTSGAIATGMLNLGQIALSMMSAGFEATTGAIGGAVKGVTGSESMGREAKALAEYTMIKPEFPGHPWMMAGHEPPLGVNKELDKSKAERNETILKGLEDITPLVQGSSTWERSPELFKNFVEQGNKDRMISIEGDTVTALYGNKVPTSDDGLLGWVPHIDEQMAAARSTGADVEIPLTEWLTHADPKVAKQLHDGIRMWPDGATKAETTVERPEVPPPRPDDVGQIRAAGGLEPVFRPQSVGAVASNHPMIIGLDTIDPKAVGLPEAHWIHLQELAQRQYEDDLGAAQKRAEREATKRETADWKDKRVDMQKEVEAETRARPNVAADLFIGSGELNGEKLQQRFTLREADLTPEQRAALPDHYVSKNGLPVDDTAALFGYGSGDSMVDALAAHNALKGERSPQEMFRDLVKAETDRRMEAKYGDLPSNIFTAAHDQALSDTTLNLVTQEYQGAAMSAGTDFLRDFQVREEAKRIADAILNRDVNSRKMLASVSKNYSDAVKGLLAQDPQAAVVALQRRAIGAHVAAELLKREKENAQTERLMQKLARWKKPGKNEVKTVDPEYINWAHVIMDKVGQKIRRSMESVKEDIAGRGATTLEGFVNQMRGWARPLDVWDQLYDSGWKKDWKQLNGEEARAVGGSLQSLYFHGRDELQIHLLTDKINDKISKNDAIKELVDKTDRLPSIQFNLSGERTDWWGRHTGQFRTYLATITQMETLFNFLDKFDPYGPWNQYISRGLIDGANQAESWGKEFTKELHDCWDKADLSKEVDNPLFRVPLDDGSGLGPLFRMTRENLRMVLLNCGNSAGIKSNLWKLAKGFGLTPEQVMAWVHQHATKEDWDWAQAVWDRVFEKMWDHGASMYRSVTGGMTPDRVRIDPIQTKFGTYRGGYMPVDAHPVFKRGKIDIDTSQMGQSNYQSALPQASWAQTRTGATYPINLDMSRLPMLITRELHDIAMRPSLIQASKLLMDSRVQDAVAGKMGMEYRDLMRPYLIGLANRHNYLTTHPRYANSILEQWRKNIVTGLVGFNPGTVMKHAPTALALSVREVGPTYFLRACRALYNGVNEETSLSNMDFVNSSHEIQRRERNWEETLYGEMLKERPGGGGATFAASMAKWSSKPVAYSDMLSAKPTFLGAYMRAMDEGRSHGDAVYEGERAVRRAHGSTALTNRPAIMREWNPWLTSVYTFFNDIVNRQMEGLWRAGELARDAKTEGGWESAKKHAPAIAATLFASVVFPAIVEEMVSPSGGPDARHDSLGTKIWKGGAYTLASGMPGVRDFVHAVLYGTDPTPAGLAKTAGGSAQNLYRDIWKKQPLSREHAERMIRDATGLAAMLTGWVTQPMGNAAAFGYGAATGAEHPKGPWGWLVGSRYGTLKHHSSTFQNWTQGKSY